MADLQSDLAWANYARFPLDLTDTSAEHPVSVRERILPLGSHIVHLSLNRAIHHFERDPEHLLDWVQDTADHLATLYLPETLPRAVTLYTARELGGFSWQQAGFTVTEDTPVQAADLMKPVAWEPLSDDPDHPNKAVLAAISSIDLLEHCGYTID